MVRFTFKGEVINLRLARQLGWWARYCKGGRYAAVERYIVLVVEKQLVIEQQICRHNKKVRSIMKGGGNQTVMAVLEVAAVTISPWPKWCTKWYPEVV